MPRSSGPALVFSSASGGVISEPLRAFGAWGVVGQLYRMTTDFEWPPGEWSVEDDPRSNRSPAAEEAA